MKEQINWMESATKRMFLDDVRPMPVGFDVYVKTAEEAIRLIKGGRIGFVSIDNDLGVGFTEGKKVAQFIESAYLSDEIGFVDFHPHTNNPAAFEEIMACKRKVYEKFTKEYKSHQP